MSGAHYYPMFPSDNIACYTATLCFHDGKKLCGLEEKTKKFREFIDYCDMQEYSCDHNESYNLEECEEDEAERSGIGDSEAEKNTQAEIDAEKREEDTHPDLWKDNGAPKPFNAEEVNKNKQINKQIENEKHTIFIPSSQMKVTNGNNGVQDALQHPRNVNGSPRRPKRPKEAIKLKDKSYKL